MRPRAGPVKTGADVAGFARGVATGLGVGVIALAGLSTLVGPGGVGIPPQPPSTDLPLPAPGTVDDKPAPQFWPGLSPEERAAREAQLLPAAEGAAEPVVATDPAAVPSVGTAEPASEPVLAAAPAAPERPALAAEPAVEATPPAASEAVAPAPEESTPPETRPAASAEPPAPDAAPVGTVPDAPPVPETADPSTSVAPSSPDPEPSAAAPVAEPAAAPTTPERSGAVEVPARPEDPAPDTSGAPAPVVANEFVERPEAPAPMAPAADLPAPEAALAAVAAPAEEALPASDPAPALADAREPAAPPAAPVVLTEAPPPVVTRLDPGSVAPTAGAEAPEPEVLTLAPPGNDRPRVLTLGSGDEEEGGVRIRRPGTEAPPSDAPAEAAAADPSAAPEDAPALRRYAAAFEPPDDSRPLVSVVLVDDGSVPDGPGLLAQSGLTVPLSVALDVPVEQAAARAQAWRAAGYEVLVVADLPPSAEPQDVEVFLGAAMDAVPEAVAVMDLGQGGFGARNAAAQMAISRLARDGQGLVTAAPGLSGGVSQAEAAGVPAVRVQRELDPSDEGAVRRGLDDAVRRAVVDGEAVVYAPLSEEAIHGIADWDSRGRRDEVAVAPVSAVLVAELPAVAP